MSGEGFAEGFVEGMALHGSLPVPVLSSRQRLVAFVAANPGCTQAEAVRATGLSHGSVVHHVRAGLAQGWLCSARMGRLVLLAVPAAPLDRLAAARLLRSEPVRRLVAMVREQPGVGTAALTRRLGMSRKEVRRRLELLVRAGVLQRSGDYRPRFTLAPVPPGAASSG